MDYREHFAHLLKHMVREVPAECGLHCPVRHLSNGSTDWRSSSGSNYTGPSLSVLFAALREVGYVAQVQTSAH